MRGRLGDPTVGACDLSSCSLVLGPIVWNCKRRAGNIQWVYDKGQVVITGVFLLPNKWVKKPDSGYTIPASIPL